MLTRAGVIAALAGTIMLIGVFFTRQNLSSRQFITIFFSIHIISFTIGWLLSLIASFIARPDQMMRLTNLGPLTEAAVYIGYFVALVLTIILFPIAIMVVNRP